MQEGVNQRLGLGAVLPLDCHGLTGKPLCRTHPPADQRPAGMLCRPGLAAGRRGAAALSPCEPALVGRCAVHGCGLLRLPGQQPLAGSSGGCPRQPADGGGALAASAGAATAGPTSADRPGVHRTAGPDRAGARRLAGAGAIDLAHCRDIDAAGQHLCLERHHRAALPAPRQQPDAPAAGGHSERSVCPGQHGFCPAQHRRAAGT